ncbi:MAG TPA: L-histidine N(alpha)-methyltransferase [Pyrinomonadaceae bacterium]|nr:L-histidine N(alpha)-methyltransferase [Pyrinomonadaceae bacterium]
MADHANPTTAAAVTRLRITRLSAGEASDSFASDVRAGLISRPKRLFPKYFYDALGSRLFDAICLLPEYYLTRAENEIFARRAVEIVEAFAAEAKADERREVALLELGSGSATKTRLIIEALLARQERLLYVPVDISHEALEESSRVLLQSYAGLDVSAYAADYDAALPRLRENVSERTRSLVLFLGSNVGNFDPTEARAFLRRLRGVLRAGDALLVGADLRKDAATLEAAYDDALGVTAAFNLNLLARLNRELDADFNLRAFRHVAHYNEAAGRVEMHLESLRAQRVHLGALDLDIDFDEGERMHTENSYKYDAEELRRLAAETGFRLTRTWLDSEGRFSSNLFLTDDKNIG